MAVTINASTSAGLVTSADTSGDLNIQSGGSTKIAVTSAGVAVTGLSKGSLPTGSVLQVVNGSYSTNVSNNTSTYADTGLTATITPTSATSKILVLVNQSGVGKGPTDIGTGVNLKLLRGSTTLVTFALLASWNNTASYSLVGSATTSYLDSPATTSATIYKTQMASAATGSAYTQSQGDTSTITLMEIAA
jgi:hypothetical protein